MAYDVSDVEMYDWAEVTAWASGAGATGAAAINKYIVGPRGKVGFVRDMIVEVTTSMVGTTSVAELQIGISSGDYTYGRYRLGTGAATGYVSGTYRASAELITGNPPRTATDYSGHVVLDGGPLSSKGIAGGSYGTVVPQGRIPASGWVITNVVQGADSSHSRIYAQGVNPGAPFKDLVTGNLVNIQGVTGSTSVNAENQAITAIDTNNLYFEVAQTFSTAYTAGGVVSLSVVVTAKANGAASGAGAGIPRIKIEWVGPQTP